MLRKPPNEWSSGRQKLCSMLEAQAEELPTVALKERVAKPFRPVLETQQENKQKQHTVMGSQKELL